MRQIIGDVDELVARHGWQTAPQARTVFLLREVIELAEEVLRLPAAGPYDAAHRQRIGREIYDVLWNACAVAQSIGIDVVEAAADKRRVNQNRTWPARKPR